MIKLDTVQNEAASFENGAALLIAGAGSGKTATSVEAVARQLEKKMPPQQILMLTFSRKAAKEMYVRLKKRMNYEDLPISEIKKKLPTIETYHSFGYKLLKEFPEFCDREKIQL